MAYRLEYVILYAQIKAESNWKRFAIERRNGKEISFGLSQASIDTAKILFPKKRDEIDKKWLLNWGHNIDVLVEFWSWRLGVHGSYKRTLSEWNLGLTGYQKYASHSRGKFQQKFFGSYVELVESRLGYRLEDID